MTAVTRDRRAPARPRALKALVLAVPFLILTGWIAAVTLHASVLVDHVRHFYLDDGQMVSLRYARHLADGTGPVWNAGERVEGYSNPGWVVVMTAVHLAGAPPETASLYVKLIAGLCAAGILVASLSLRRTLGPSTLAGEAVLLLALVMNADVVFWAANGFETTLLTAVFVWLLARVVREAGSGSVGALSMVVAGCLPVIRSDAHLLTLAVVAVGIGLARDRRRSVRLAALALALPAAHVLARMVYYGDALPNTFYLRYANATGVWREGARYLRALVSNYWVLIGVAGAGVFVSRDRRRLWLLVPVAAAGMHALAAGGDMFAHFRFFAPAVPVLLVLAVATADTWAGEAGVRRAIALVVLLAFAVSAGGMVRPRAVDAMRSWRGKPWRGVVMGRLVDRYSRPSATLAAADIGALAYFSNRTVVDLSGRTDSFIARGQGRPGADAAARKFDIAHSLARQPDFVITDGPHDDSRLGEVMFALHGVDPARDIFPALLASPVFQRDYRDNPVPLTPLIERRALYVHNLSRERAHVSRWRFPEASF